MKTKIFLSLIVRGRTDEPFHTSTLLFVRLGLYQPLNKIVVPSFPDSVFASITPFVQPFI